MEVLAFALFSTASAVFVDKLQLTHGI